MFDLIARLQQMIVFPPVRVSTQLFLSRIGRQTWGTVNLICCLLLWKWNRTAIKHKKPLAAVTSHGLYLMRSAMCNMELHCCHWLACVDLLNCVFFVSLFSHPKLYFILKMIQIRNWAQLSFPTSCSALKVTDLFLLVTDGTGRKWMLNNINGGNKNKY